MLLSEADIREKVITPWLSSIGLQASDVSMEHSFTIRLGRNVYKVTSSEHQPPSSERIGRADYLVRGFNNTNLFVIEAKALNQELTVEDRDQAISYARLLTEGNIAPFVIVTNGRDTRIYDTLTKEIINDTHSFTNHPHVKNGFQISCDIEAQSEALSYLISLNSNNLIAFCKNQVEYRMKALKSNDLSSGKKYIPQLYITRSENEKKLNELLFSKDKPRSAVLVTGPPQNGKTSFLCYMIEKCLEQNIPCLFYPAFGLKAGLLSEIQDDFQWSFNNNLSINSIVNRLKSVLLRSSQRLILFIDGLNEIDRERAFEISQTCERILTNVQIVVSATSNSLERLLFEYDNPTCLSEATGITRNDTRILKTRQLINSDRKSIVQVHEFTHDETYKAINVYAKAYNVKVPHISEELQNPFNLKTAMETYAGKELPAVVNTKELIQSNLYRKAARANLNLLEFKIAINRICSLLLKHDYPLCCFEKLDIDTKLLQKLCDAAIIAEVHNESELQGIDFYYSRERDYAIAYELKQWNTLFLDDGKDIIHEIEAATLTAVGKEALRWFFSSPTHIKHLKKCFKISKNCKCFQEVFIYAIINQNFQETEDFEWLRMQLDTLYNSNTNELKPLFLYKLIKPSHSNCKRITSNQVYLLKLLLLEESETLKSEVNDKKKEIIDPEGLYSFELMTEHNFCNSYFQFLLDDDDAISNLASLLMSYIDNDEGNELLDAINYFISSENQEFAKKKNNFIDGLRHIESEYRRINMYCGGAFADADSLEEWIFFYDLYRSRYLQIVKLYANEEVFLTIKQDFNHIVRRIQSFQAQDYIYLKDDYKIIAREVIDNSILAPHFVKNPLQLYLPLSKELITLNNIILSKQSTNQ